MTFPIVVLVFAVIFAIILFWFGLYAGYSWRLHEEELNRLWTRVRSLEEKHHPSCPWEEDNADSYCNCGGCD